MFLRNFGNIINRYSAIEDIFWFYYHRRANLAEPMATSKLYLNIQTALPYLLF
jgi:hypothetical protein